MHNAVRKDFLEILNEESNLQENYEFATHEYFPALFQLFPDSQMDTLYWKLVRLEQKTSLDMFNLTIPKWV